MKFKAILKADTEEIAVPVEACDRDEARKKVSEAFPKHVLAALLPTEMRAQKVLDVGTSGLVECPDKPRRLWTLLGKEEISLPYAPVHQVNAFLEDETHDWCWRNGVIRYYSRLADLPARILVEY